MDEMLDTLEVIGDGAYANENLHCRCACGRCITLKLHLRLGSRNHDTAIATSTLNLIVYQRDGGRRHGGGDGNAAPETTGLVNELHILVRRTTVSRAAPEPLLAVSLGLHVYPV